MESASRTKMKLRLLNPDEGPQGKGPDGYQFVHENGFTNKAGSLSALIEVAREHRESNGLPIPPDFNAQVETQICMGLPDEKCVCYEGVRDTSCRYRGDFIRWVTCAACCGGKGVKGKVVTCELHGEATQFSKDLGVKSCATCMDRKPITSQG